MIDCDIFTEFNRSLIMCQDRAILDYKNCSYNLEIMFPNQSCRKIQKQNVMNFNKKIPIKAVYGIMDMEVNSYVVAVTKASLLGQIYHRKIFQVQKIEFFCLAAKENTKDKIYINGLNELFGTKYFYFSDNYDLTSSLQEFVNSGYSMKNKKINYMFNFDWVDDFLKIKAYEWITGFISGYVAINFTHAGPSSSCQTALISRRDRRRQGCRWITRGADIDGNTVNTAETEIVFLTDSGGKESVFSHVQLRGSMPFFWEQFPDMKWNPDVTIHSNDKLNCEVISKNYHDIKKSYDNCTLINLIDRKGSQKKLGEYFQQIHNSINDEDMKLVWFDFHAECKKMKYENLAKLLDMVSDQLSNYGYFHIEHQSAMGDRVTKKAAQKGIFRTNCMDCLDRTNVVQSVIARQLLLGWLSKLGITNKGRGTSAFEKLPQQLEQIFRVQWTHNADVLSILYSGTPAMKTDFTATGKRTKKGAAKDLYSGIKRYVLGNFYDSRKQDFIDFSLKKLKPKKNESERIRHSACNSMYAFMVLIILMVAAVNHQVNLYTDPISSNLMTKVPIIIIFVLLVFKLAQKSSTMFVRAPIRSNNNI